MKHFLDNCFFFSSNLFPPLEDSVSHFQLQADTFKLFNYPREPFWSLTSFLKLDRMSSKSKTSSADDSRDLVDDNESEINVMTALITDSH